ncbi:MAG: ATP synthase subunit I [Pseudomonadales bacterium]|nr:ATP synthase subunit I [Pseudomonadales bacterium]
MLTKRDQSNRTLAKKISVLQLCAVVFVTILIFFITNVAAALAVAVGGLVGYLSSAIYLRVALKPLDNMNPNKVVSRFYKGGALKFVTLFALFFVALKITKEISQEDYMIFLLAGLVVSQLVHAIGPVLIKPGK